MSIKIHVANPSDKGFWSDSYLLSFGCGPWSVHVLAYANCVGDALEYAADELIDRKLFGIITPHSAPQEDLGCDCADPFECDSHTYTERGWLTAHEWLVNENPTKATLVAIAHPHQ